MGNCKEKSIYKNMPEQSQVGRNSKQKYYENGMLYGLIINNRKLPCKPYAVQNVPNTTRERSKRTNAYKTKVKRMVNVVVRICECVCVYCVVGWACNTSSFSFLRGYTRIIRNIALFFYCLYSEASHIIFVWNVFLLLLSVVRLCCSYDAAHWHLKVYLKPINKRLSPKCLSISFYLVLFVVDMLNGLCVMSDWLLSKRVTNIFWYTNSTERWKKVCVNVIQRIFAENWFRIWEKLSLVSARYFNFKYKAIFPQWVVSIQQTFVQFSVVFFFVEAYFVEFAASFFY